MEFLFIAIVLLITGLVVLAFIGTLRRQRQETEKRRKAQAESGFTVHETPPEAFEQRIFALYSSPHQQQFRLKNVASRRTMDGDVYVFDLWETSGDSDTQLANQGIAMISSYLALPRFSLQPRLQMSGALAGLANRVIEWAASKSGQVVDFEQHPEFNSRFILTAEDPETVREFFTPALLDRLASKGAIAIEAGDDIFAFTPSPYGTPPTESSPPQDLRPQDLRQSMSQAQELYQLFSAYAGRAASGTPATSTLTGGLHCTQCGAQLPPLAPGTSTVRCEYCGQEVMLWSEAPARPAVRRSSSTFPRFIVRSQRNSTGGSACLLPFSIVWTLFSAFFLVIGVGTYIHERSQYSLLVREGKQVPGVVTHLEIDYDSDGDSYYVYYRFNAPVNSRVQAVEGRQSISPSFYDTLQEGQAIAVVYAPSNPGVSDLSETLAPPSLMLPVCFGGMGGLFTLIGLAMLAGSLSSVAKTIRRWMGQQTAAA